MNGLQHRCLHSLEYMSSLPICALRSISVFLSVRFAYRIDAKHTVMEHNGSELCARHLVLITILN